MATVEEKYTRCPGCLTVFRVTPAQLALRDGQVRCGHCRTVFNGYAQMISLAPMPRDSIDDDLALGPPTVTLRSARALDPPPQESARAIPEPSFRAHDDAAMPRATIRTVRETDAAQRSALRERRSNAKLRRRLWAAAIPMLSALLVGQVLFHFRDALAAYWPASKPALAVLCKATGCVIGPPRDISGVWIDASDLEAHPSHKGLLILSATVRSRANTALAYPDLVLTLTDTSDQIVARRSFAPSEYAAEPAIAKGIPPNGEVLVKLYIDASAITAAGYRLAPFYP